MIPDRMPPPIPLPPPTTKIPRVFRPFGTIVYGIAAMVSITWFMLIGIANWIPPWYIILPVFLYTFICTGTICLGRIQSNKDSKAFISALKQRSEENKRYMN